MIFGRYFRKRGTNDHGANTAVDALLREALRRHETGDTAAAEAGYRHVLQLEPEHPAAIHFLGMLAHQSGRHEDGITLIQRSIERAPQAASFRANLGAVFGQLGRSAEAVDTLRAAVRLNPNLAEAHKNLGLALESLERFNEAATSYRQGLQVAPHAAEIEAHLARVMARSGDPPDPITLPDERGGDASAHALAALASAYERQGCLDAAIEAYRRLLRFRPQSPSAHSALLYLLLHDPNISPDELFLEHQRWASQHAAALAPFRERHINDPNPDRVVRIGYVTPNFKRHPSPRFILPLLCAHDRARFTVFCYSDSDRADEVTRNVQATTDVWRDTARLSDEQFCETVSHDQIDILIDLVGHMGGNRMLAFARRLAPLQITNLYPHSTGLPTMDGQITDIWANPMGSERYHSEHLLRLEHTGWGYRPPAEGPPPSGLPALATGHVTFGSLNRLLKVNSSVIDTWAKVLDAVPKSRLIALIEDERGGERLRARFCEHGISGSRIQVVQRGSHQDYLHLTRQIDIALDTFPYNGQTTSYDMLWMGLPMITLAGETPACRLGLGLLANLGLTDLVASTPEQYVGIASALAANLDRLRDLRSNLRERMRCSVLMDERALTARTECAYRQIWKNWCERAG